MGIITRGKFDFTQAQSLPIQTALYQKHLERADKSHIVPFAGYLLPLWYSSISQEHQAVRHTAGLFDCTHMGVLEFAGPDAEPFLNLITVNNVAVLQVGQAQYSYILDAAGDVLDDIIIYRRDADIFMVIVNAANEPKIKAYIKTLQTGSAVIDIENQQRKLSFRPDIRDLRDATAGAACRADIALQGPSSLDILLRLVNDAAQPQIRELKPFGFLETNIRRLPVIVSRTGYTGSETGFELLVHPENAPQLWDMVIEAGKPLGLIPCGLGARDSLRIEAGLPLYGHELAGPFDISPYEAGYGWAVKLLKEFFIGKSAMEKKSTSCDMQVTRLRLPGHKGIRPVRQNDAILTRTGLCIGWVLSAAGTGQEQIALAYLTKDAVKQDDPVGVYYLARNKSQIELGRKEQVKKEEVLTTDLSGTVVSRFAKF